MKFSVVTPVYNREDCIGRCIESVLKQEGDFEVEHLIGYDKSTDGTLRVIENYTGDDRLRLLVLPEHGGINKARNSCIKKATGDYVIILDSDDWFIDNALQKIAQTIKSKSEYKYFMFAQNDRIPYYKQNPKLCQEYNELTYYDFLTKSVSGDFTHVINTPIIRDNPFDEEVNSYEGIYFLRFYKSCGKMLFHNTLVVERERNREDNATQSTIRRSDTVIKREIKANLQYFEWFSDDLLTCNAQAIIEKSAQRLLTDTLMVGDKEGRKKAIDILDNFNIPVSAMNVFLMNTSTGSLYKHALWQFNKLQATIKK